MTVIPSVFMNCGRNQDYIIVRKLRPNQFLLLASDGSVGYGVFPEVEWHKKEREDIMRSVGVCVEYGEELKESE